MTGLVLWITGLPGSGKSTIADALREHYPDFIILRMDDLRKVVTPQPTYSEEERDILYRGLVYLAKVLSELSHPVIIDATGNLRRWRDLARGLIPRFAEVYLSCPIGECARRERTRKDRRGAPRDIYAKAAQGWPVPGINAPYEAPVNPEVLIDSRSSSVEEALSMIRDFLNKK